MFSFARNDREAELERLEYIGRSSLMIALVRGHTDGAFKLLEEGVSDVNATDSKRASALHYAARYGDLRLVNKLIEMGAKIDEYDDGFRKPLSEAASHEHWEVAERLLQAGADPNSFVNYNNHILRIPANKRHKKGTELFLRAGADPRMKDPNRRSVISFIYDCVRYSGMRSALEYADVGHWLESYPVVVPLIVLCLRKIHYSRDKPAIPEWFPSLLLEWPNPDDYLLPEPLSERGEKRKREEAAEAQSQKKSTTNVI